MNKTFYFISNPLNVGLSYPYYKINSYFSFRLSLSLETDVNDQFYPSNEALHLGDNGLSSQQKLAGQGGAIVIFNTNCIKWTQILNSTLFLRGINTFLCGNKVNVKDGFVGSSVSY